MSLLSSSRKKIALIVLAVILSLGNASGLAFAFVRSRQGRAVSLPPPIERKLDIKNVKKQTADVTKVGQKVTQGSYASEELAKSKINSDKSAELVVATHESTGANFLLAFRAGGAKPEAKDLSAGWQLTTIANDPLWSPGACASKPTFLIKGDYIFIDDGKVNSTDKYSSYVLFDIKKGTYKYFGGEKFTADQGDKEKVLFVANEDDKLVFYIDPVDAISGNAPGRDYHVTSQASASILRRVVDPVSLKYQDYTLPYDVPRGVDTFTVVGFNDRLSGATFFINDQRDTTQQYSGTVSSNKISFLAPTVSKTAESPVFDQAIELELNPLLEQSLSDYKKDQKPYAGSQYKTLFDANGLGSVNSLQFFNVTQRYGISRTEGTLTTQISYSTPVVYDRSKSTVYPLLIKPLISSSDYVNLGVF